MRVRLKKQKNRIRNSRAVLLRSLRNIGVEQKGIIDRINWIRRWEIPKSKIVKVDSKRGPAVENSPYHFQYYLKYVNRNHEEARILLAEDAEYWQRAYEKNLEKMRQIQKKLARRNR